jgi:type IX secretion system PorP/SprF family membrane protein
MFHKFQQLPVRIRICIVVFFTLVVGPVLGQDPQFSQFYSNKMYLAPSFVGATQQHRVATTMRNQWPGIKNPYLTFTLSYEHYFANFNSGVGILFMRDQAGAGNLGMTNVGLQYSYNLRMFGNWYFRPGFHFIYTTRSVDYYKLKFINDITHETSVYSAPTNESVSDIDFAGSVLVYNPIMWFGASVDHLLEPNQSFYGDKSFVPLKIQLFGGAQLIKRGKLLKPIDESLSLAFLYKNQDLKNQLDLGMYWYKSPLMLGLWYRGIPIMKWNRADALALVIGVKTQSFSIGYSYDFTVSKLMNNTHGAHELSMIYEFTTVRRRKMHAIPCPEF